MAAFWDIFVSTMLVLSALTLAGEAYSEESTGAIHAIIVAFGCFTFAICSMFGLLKLRAVCIERWGVNILYNEEVLLTV
ncbi:hypothetical protein QR680_015189 [Steinernema hermaphroditum]|uniref:MARVEL domain-containing protein n=1 Tax=Steinernema hermaphroditum TaxID=289476 RepID=A0AA39IBG2_9BILA|nr:hypothetical protein QR680_015189 [Steinernema hermaphroditum]